MERLRCAQVWGAINMGRARAEQDCRRATAGKRQLKTGAHAAASLAVAGAALLCGLTARAGGGLFGPPPVPDWVHDAVRQTLPAYPKSTKAVVLLDETTYTVDAKGQAIEHQRMVVKILRPQGREYGMPRVWYDKDSKVLSLHVWSIDPNGHEYSLKDNEIADVSPPSGGDGYGDVRARIAEPPGLDPGGIVAYESEVRERPYLAETTWSYQGELPEVKESFTLELPAGFKYATTWTNHSPVDAADLEGRGYRWEMSNVAAIDVHEVPMSPSAESLAGRMTVHYSGPGLAQPQDGTWQGLGVWYDGLSHDRLQPTPDVAAKAQALTAGKTDFYDKSRVLGEFVQSQIRYFSIDLGIGGFQPHPAGETLKGRYGDCKDKATLLVAMLGSVGIHGALVIVDTERNVIDPDDPSITANHAIAAIEVPKGYESAKMHSVFTAETGKRYLLFDPTWAQTPFGQIEDNLQGSWGVLMEGADSQVFQIPLMPPELNTIRRNATLVLGTDGTLSGAITDKRFGDIASWRRGELQAEDGKNQQALIDRIIAQDVPAATVTGLKFENVTALDQDLVTSFDLKASHFASSTGPLLMVRPRVFGSYAPDVDRKPRRVSVDLERTMQATDSFDIQLPEGYAVDELPDPVKVDFGFASYESKTELQGRTLHYARTYTVRQVTLSAAKYEDLQKLAGIIAADEDSRAVLKRAK
jgi:transglutaminase-like putative cysteine protease